MDVAYIHTRENLSLQVVVDCFGARENVLLQVVVDCVRFPDAVGRTTFKFP